jgi:hypothetical protein
VNEFFDFGMALKPQPYAAGWRDGLPKKAF